MMDNKKYSLGINDLIQRVKHELLQIDTSNETDIFSIDEILLELNFAVSGDLESGFNIGVVTLGSNISEERVQKVTIKMTPLVTKEQIIDTINQKPNESQSIIDTSARAFTRGSESSIDAVQNENNVRGG
jgi:hypothetical protein